MDVNVSYSPEMDSTMEKQLKETFDYSADDARFMQMAIDLSVENVDTGGGPFGAVIVRDGEMIATGTNRVVPNADPTAYAERSIRCEHFMRDEALAAFRKWEAKDDKVRY